MSKQHHPATIFFLLVAIIVAAVLGWRATELKEQLNASILETGDLKQQLEAETNKRIGVEHERDSLRRALSGNEAELHELMQRVHVVHDAALDVVIEGATETGEITQKVPVVAIELIAGDGRVWRFMNDFEQIPVAERTDANTVRLTFRCHPVRTADIEGRPIQELEAVTRVRTSYQAVVADLGLTVSPESTRQLVFRIDGMEVVNTVPTLVAPDTWEYDVTAAFAGLYPRYQDQLRSRINAASAAGTLNDDPAPRSQ